MTSADSIAQEGGRLHLAGDEEGARVHYLAALQQNPIHLASLANLAQLASNRNQIAAGAVLSRRVVSLVPHDGIQLSNYGNLLTRLERYEEAEKVLLQAAKLIPDNINVWANLLLLMHRTGQQDQALFYMGQVMALGGETPQTLNDRAHLYFAKGDLEKGLIDYEARWHQMLHLEPWDFHIPEWTGQDLRGKRILVHHEQGFGDTIMTARFVKTLSLMARVTFGLPTALVRLFDHQDWPIETLDISKMDQDDAKGFDFHSPLWSMVRWMGITKDQIHGAQYLQAPKLTTWNIPHEAFNVGICWSSGKRGSVMDWRRRVSPLEPWLRLAEDPRVLLWSLNKHGEASQEIRDLGAEGLINDPTSSFETFAECAALVEKLDLVITVDTAIAHVAGALGKPVWMLSQYTPCWRWWNLAHGSGKPWYDSVVILRQSEPGGWAEQLELCRKNLSRQIKNGERMVA